MNDTVEPVAWMHNARRRDVVSSDVKELAHKAFLHYGVHSRIERSPVDKSENYTIPLYKKSAIDTYRDLCGELISSARAKLDARNLNDHVKTTFELEAAINKAEAFMGPDRPDERTMDAKSGSLAAYGFTVDRHEDHIVVTGPDNGQGIAYADETLYQIIDAMLPPALTKKGYIKNG